MTIFSPATTTNSSQGEQSVKFGTRDCQRKSGKLRIKLVVCKYSYAVVARLDWYRRLTSGFSDVGRSVNVTRDRKSELNS